MNYLREIAMFLAGALCVWSLTEEAYVIALFVLVLTAGNLYGADLDRWLTKREE